MKKQLLMTSILAFGMGFAQAQNPAPMQGSAPDTSNRGSTAQTPAGTDRTSAPAAASPTGVAEQATGPQSFKGCLTGTTGSWTLASDNGQTLKISGTDDQLSTYNNQQINIHGTQATDGTIKVASIDKISDSCSATGQAATSPGNTEQNTATSGQAPATSTSQPPDSSSTGAMSNQSTTTSNTQSTTSTTSGQPPSTGEAAPSQSTTGAQTGTASTTTPSTGTPPVSEQTPSSTVGGNTSDQGAAQQPPASTTGQGATATGQSATTGGQTGNVPHISDMDQNQAGTAGNQAAGQNAGQQKLPQTASPLPLLGLMGLGSLVAGLVGRRRK